MSSRCTGAPYGILNSVGLAQHMHRKCCQAKPCSQQPLEVEPHELRRDRPAPVGKNEEPVRVYLDNWDELKKVDRSLCAEVEGKSSVHQLALRQQYMNVNLPRPPRSRSRELVMQRFKGLSWMGDRAWRLPNLRRS